VAAWRGFSPPRPEADRLTLFPTYAENKTRNVHENVKKNGMLYITK
jgi:hypothetical protein